MAGSPLAQEESTADSLSSAIADGEAREAILRMVPAEWSARGRRLLDFDRDGIGLQASPPLSFSDGHFDLIWAASAFTRLAVGWAEWLLELRRLLADDGLLAVGLGPRERYRELSGMRWEEGDVGMSWLASLDGGDEPVIFHSEWWLRAHWGRAFEILAHDSQQGRPWVLMRGGQARVSPEDLERPEPGDERESRALRANVAVLWRQHEATRARTEARLRGELDAQREELNREIMRKSFELAEREWGWGGPDSASALTAAAYQATLSWRITRPLRAAGRLLRRI